MTHQEPKTVEQPAFNDIYKLLIEIRRRRKERDHAGRNLR